MPHRRRNQGATNNQGAQQPNGQATLGQADLIAVATAVAQAVTGSLQQQQQQQQGNGNTNAFHGPRENGTKVHYENMKKARVPTFGGEIDPEKVEKWIKDVEDSFLLLEIPENVKTKVVVPFLVGDAKKW